MNTISLQGVAALVVRRAEQQGFVVPRQVREELGQAGLSSRLWKDVLALARPSLSYRHGRYYYSATLTTRARQEQSRQQLVQRAIRQLVRSHRAGAGKGERRKQDRLDFVQTVLVTTEDGQQLTLLSRDISPTGIRLIGTRQLLGQKLQVRIPRPGEASSWIFSVRILWSCAVGDGLFESGGTLLEVASSSEAS